jgi:hypothetical protein
MHTARANFYMMETVFPQAGRSQLIDQSHFLERLYIYLLLFPLGVLHKDCLFAPRAAHPSPRRKSSEKTKTTARSMPSEITQKELREL